MGRRPIPRQLNGAESAQGLFCQARKNTEDIQILVLGRNRPRIFQAPLYQGQLATCIIFLSRSSHL